jgi:hypothetical protein
VYLDAIDIRILSKIADELVDIIYIYCLTWMCVGEGPGFDPHSSSSWPEVCVYKQPSLRAFICPVGRGAIKVRYAFVM